MNDLSFSSFRPYTLRPCSELVLVRWGAVQAPETRRTDKAAFGGKHCPPRLQAQRMTHVRSHQVRVFTHNFAVLLPFLLSVWTIDSYLAISRHDSRRLRCLMIRAALILNLPNHAKGSHQA